MIETEASVLSVEHDGVHAWVETRPHGSCGACAGSGGCHSVSISRLFSVGRQHYRVANPIGAQAGDKVIVAVAERALLHSSLLMYLVHYTKIGRAMRATAENPRVAGLMGVKPDVVISATFIIGAVLAAIAGVMYASNYGTAQHTMGFLPGLKAFTAAVFGGIGNLGGAVLGGLLLGLIEAIGSGYIGTLTGGLLGSHYTDIFAFIVLIIVLTLRPSGLLGERVADRA